MPAAPIATLDQDVALLRSYLELMQMRMPDRLDFKITIDPALRGLRLPPMTLLTLVENAVHHGIDPSEAGGRIEVGAQRNVDGGPSRCGCRTPVAASTNRSPRHQAGQPARATAGNPWPRTWRACGLSGIDAARSMAGRAQIVFVTACEQYAVKAFEQGAIDDLVKPFDEARLAETVQRLKQRLQPLPAGAAPDGTVQDVRERLAGELRGRGEARRCCSGSRPRWGPRCG